jgi:septal ring factor EnvC (AmiA/AmiB activator)
MGLQVISSKDEEIEELKKRLKEATDIMAGLKKELEVAKAALTARDAQITELKAHLSKLDSELAAELEKEEALAEADRAAAVEKELALVEAERRAAVGGVEWSLCWLLLSTAVQSARYDARARAALRRLTRELGVPWQALILKSTLLIVT